MIKQIFSLLALLLTFTSFSQNTPVADSRVTDYFGSAKVQNWATQHPDSIRYYNFIVQNSFEIWTSENAALRSDSKTARVLTLTPADTELLNTDLSQFNILKTGLKYLQDSQSWWIVEGTDYYLLLQSKNYIDKKIKSSK